MDEPFPSENPLIFPEAEVAIQEIVEAGVEDVNAIEVGLPLQICCDKGVTINMGPGLTKMTTCIVDPLHPFAEGTIV